MAYCEALIFPGLLYFGAKPDCAIGGWNFYQVSFEHRLDIVGSLDSFRKIKPLPEMRSVGYQFIPSYKTWTVMKLSACGWKGTGG